MDKLEFCDKYNVTIADIDIDMVECDFDCASCNHNHDITVY
jgi:hypothetical protein